MSPQAIYDAAWHHPGIAWVAAVATAVAFARKQRFLVGWTALFLLAVVADAWATGAFSRVPAPHAWIAGVVFVILQTVFKVPPEFTLILGSLAVIATAVLNPEGVAGGLTARLRRRAT